MNNLRDIHSHLKTTSISFLNNVQSFTGRKYSEISVAISNESDDVLNDTPTSSPQAEMVMSYVDNFSLETFSQKGISHATPLSLCYHTGCKRRQL